MENYFFGELVEGEELKKIARQRKNKHHETTIHQAELPSKEQEGWEIKRPLKYNKVKIRRLKKCDELLEDKVWLLFYSMGFTELNKDRNFKIQAGPTKKQIDVFAKEGNNAFIVECKASSEDKHISKKDIHEISDLKEDIRKAIIERYKKKIRVSFIIATRGIKWNKDDEKLAKDKVIFIWREAELEYYDAIVKHLGNSAKYQLYSIFFKKDYELKKIRVPAISGKWGKVKYYSFVIQPEKLLQVAYVHHRRSNLGELLGSYQRMLNKTRLNRIKNFIDKKDGYFPNNIIINFTKRPKFDQKAPKEEGITFGILTFPPYRSSAWIIDGQHRLYGYANSKRITTATLPVLAFESIDVKDQAKLFVDINKEQKAVEANLLWDLYPDIYRDSKDEEHQLLRAISRLVKKLNSDKDSPLYSYINMPSVPAKEKRKANLTINTICDSIEDTELINKEGGILYKENYDSTVDYSGEILKKYLQTIAESFPEDWEKGNTGLLRTNIGIRIFLIILEHLLKGLKYIGKERTYKKRYLNKFKNEVKRLLSPAIEELKSMTNDERGDIRKASAKGKVLDNARKLGWCIKTKFEWFGPELFKGWARPIPNEVVDEQIGNLVKDTEIKLRSLIINSLKEFYGEEWWDKGITKGIKDAIDEKIKEEIENAPHWRKEELSSLKPERKMNYTYTSHLREIIEYRPNWDEFAKMFVKDKDRTTSRFKSFESIRHAYAHHREGELDEITKKQGYWDMLWIRKCIGLEK